MRVTAPERTYSVQNVTDLRKGINLDRDEIMMHFASFRKFERPRLVRLGDYYGGKHDILKGQRSTLKPDNRLVNNFCRSITDCTVGYFLGIPITYSSDDAGTLRLAAEISSYNDEAFQNSALARDMSVYGRAAELIWVDGDGVPRFSALDPTSVFPIMSDSLDEEVRAAVRFYVPRFSSDTVVEVYGEDGIETFRLDGGKLEKTGEKEHYFGMVPVNFYRNNRDMTGDFEPVLSLVDAYNRLESDCVNDFELFADSYLVISGMGGADREDIERFRRERVLLVDEGGDARWLTKTTNDAYIENLKNRIAKDIYRFSNTVDMAEETVGKSALSGTAIKYRMANFDNRVCTTEQYFRRSLMRRWEVISCVSAKLGGALDWQALRPQFVRNLPGNYESAAAVAKELDGIVSRKTIHELLPFIANADTEAARMAAERKEA